MLSESMDTPDFGDAALLKDDVVPYMDMYSTFQENVPKMELIVHSFSASCDFRKYYDHSWV